MVLKKILWISCKIKKEKSILTPFWVQRTGFFIVNIVYDNGSVKDLINTITAVRTLRVGIEAHYPQIHIYTTVNKINSNFIQEVCEVDTSTPRIGLTIILDNSNYNQEKLDSTIALSKTHFLSTKILYILNEKALDTGKAKTHHPDNIDIIYEWFPKTNSNENINCLKIVEWLNNRQYDFFKHPLYLGGAISLISRKIIAYRYDLKCNGLNLDKKNEQEGHIDRYIKTFNSISPHCTLGMIDKLLTCPKYSKHRLCSCSENYEISLDIDIDLLAFHEKQNRKNDLRLFEDWQYIYDGFDYV